MGGLDVPFIGVHFLHGHFQRFSNPYSVSGICFVAVLYVSNLDKLIRLPYFCSGVFEKNFLDRKSVV